jgi:hypothetical protein
LRWPMVMAMTSVLRMRAPAVAAGLLRLTG